MEDKNNDKNEIDEEKEEKKDECKNNVNNKKEENETNFQSNKIEIKKPVISEAEYQNMMQKRKLMTKNSKIKPMQLLFGKKKQPLNLSNSVQIQNHNIKPLSFLWKGFQKIF